MNTSLLHLPAQAHSQRPRAGDIGLWVFMGVASTLFALFITAYAMRMTAGDWSPITLPWQLWLSTGWLVAGSLLMHSASVAARHGRGQQLNLLLLAGGGCAMAFVAVQLWAWSSLQAARVVLASNPAASFFYVLTALHGLHVLGGLVAWTTTMRGAQTLPDGAAREPDPTLDEDTAQRITLCARYWHFLLAVWVLLFVTLGWLTPEFVRYICGTT
ncbi:bb3-type cytochrome oxidase subunit III [Aquabacterium sp.]|uniref:bb3-type cytochrome oxidase subunit III n=1 Tax=Aquabacterium sp. TaxID=1872578 RepID=UPI002C49528E|nr:bb3-type cytochrome oxidase subunit III [Aquabacterium sp.]HSW02951.1 bb3-type cytochrome oxidase subunit III [Aquabacterium sp.]